MLFRPYVFDSEHTKIYIEIIPMTQADAELTKMPPEWQSDWTSEYIASPKLEKYAAKIGNHTIALAAYEIKEHNLIVHIAYMESCPDSNPVLCHGNKMYNGIGKVLIAYGIKLSIDNGFAGDVTLDAKTTQLENYYIKKFGAVKLPVFSSSAPRLLIADTAAKNIFFSYLEPAGEEFT